MSTVSSTVDLPCVGMLTAYRASSWLIQGVRAMLRSMILPRDARAAGSLLKNASSCSQVPFVTETWSDEEGTKSRSFDVAPSALMSPLNRSLYGFPLWPLKKNDA